MMSEESDTVPGPTDCHGTAYVEGRLCVTVRPTRVMRHYADRGWVETTVGAEEIALMCRAIEFIYDDRSAVMAREAAVHVTVKDALGTLAQLRARHADTKRALTADEARGVAVAAQLAGFAYIDKDGVVRVASEIA